MLEETVAIHDKFRFEIKMAYEIEADQEKSSYDIDTYFFIPYNLGINHTTYTREIFYKDIQTYIRLKTPTLLLRQINESETTPLIRLENSIQTLREQRNKITRTEYEYHVKMVCSIIKSALRDHVLFIEKQLPAEWESLFHEFIAEARKILAGYRELKPLINVPIISEKSLAIYRFGDEFISLNVEDYAFKLLKLLEKTTATKTKGLKNLLVVLIDQELKYRISAGYQAVNNEKLKHEILIYRQGVLKKYIGSALFLDTRRESEGKLIEQILYGLAAGLSMLLATLVAFYAQKYYGNLTFPLLAVLVVSYIFKDRLKEILRVYLIHKLTRFIFDHKTNIYGEEKLKIGICKEAFRFVRDEDLPAKIKKIRQREHITDVENSWRGEKVIYYRKQVKLFSQRLKQAYPDYEFDGVNDIFRFNVNRFLIKMDDPIKRIFSLKDNQVVSTSGNRVYHINLIQKISRDSKASYKRFRLVLTRKGIQRIEPVESVY
jgi:hypothetical protein